MSEKLSFKRQYRRFAEAAKRSGVIPSIEDRRSAFKGADSLLFGKSEELKQDISPDALKLFFNVLQGHHNAGHQPILKIANFLYNHRPPQETASGEKAMPLSPEDRPLANLACALIEDAFYRGNLLNMPKEHGAVLAFTVNVLAKILEKSPASEGLNGFDRQRLRRFIEEVTAFESQCHQRAVRRDEDAQKENHLHAYFLSGARRGNNLLKEKNTAAYLIKNVLMADNRIGSIKDKHKREDEENNLRALRFGSEDTLSQFPNRVLTYSMLTHGRPTPFKSERGSNYVNLHFFPEDIPFAVWALRYLRSQAGKRRDKMTK